jgi:hypothetical protein
VAQDIVTTIFGGDDSPFQAAVRRVKQAMEGVAGFKPPGDVFKSVHASINGIGTAAHAAAGFGVPDRLRQQLNLTEDFHLELDRIFSC